MSAKTLIRASVVGHIANIELNDPDSRNALSLAMRKELRDCLEEFAQSSMVRAIILSGAGSAFCAGGDLKSLSEESMPSMLDRQHNVEALVRLLAQGNKPIIAAVEGAAVGAGLSIAAACDIVVAGRDARFAAVFGKVGLLPDLGLTWTLPKRVGTGRAKLMVLTGRSVPAPLACEWGLVDELVEAGSAIAAANDIATEIAGNAPLSVRLSKRAFDRSGGSLSQTLELEASNQTLMLGTDDFREGYSAFRQKRIAEFKGS